MSKQPLSSKKHSPRYDAAFKRHAAEQVLIHHQPVAAVAYVNLTNMRKFFLQFPNVYALRKELSWTQPGTKKQHTASDCDKKIDPSTKK